VSEQFLNDTSAHIRLFSALHDMVDLHKEGRYNQGYLATIKMN